MAANARLMEAYPLFYIHPLFLSLSLHQEEEEKKILLQRFGDKREEMMCNAGGVESS